MRWFLSRSLPTQARWLAPAVAVAMVGAAAAGVAVWRDHTASAGSRPQSTTPSVVARVGSEDVSGQLFDTRFRLSMTLISQQGGSVSPGSVQDAAFQRQVRAQVMKGLIIDSIIAQEAGARHLAASDADVEGQVRQRIQDAGGERQLLAQLATVQGSEEQLRDEIRSSLNEQRLEDLLARDRAALALQQLGAGTPFATVAAQISDDDTSRSKGGDMGTLTEQQLVAAGADFAAAVKALAPGQYSAQPFRDAAGYEILLAGPVGPSGRELHRILVAAPQPYTVKERPQWFVQAIYAAIEQDCQSQALRLYVDIGENPCAARPAPATPPPASPAAR